METEPTNEQRLAYSEWLVADEAAIDARDEVLMTIEAGDGVIDLELLERLSARATELRKAADRALRGALAALNLPPDAAARLEVEEATDVSPSGVALIRTIVNLEVSQISRRARESLGQSTSL
jgi:hypothetical protein